MDAKNKWKLWKKLTIKTRSKGERKRQNYKVYRATKEWIWILQQNKEKMLEIRIIIMCLPTFLFGTTLEPGKLNESFILILFIIYLPSMCAFPLLYTKYNIIRKSCCSYPHSFRFFLLCCLSSFSPTLLASLFSSHKTLLKNKKIFSLVEAHNLLPCRWRSRNYIYNKTIDKLEKTKFKNIFCLKSFFYIEKCFVYDKMLWSYLRFLS